jgi:mitogen-activated protein kinase organizer 1
MNKDPVTSIHLLKDAKTMAVSTLNSTIRLMDRERGEMLQKFTGHRSLNYRSRISMSYDEAQVLAGDEDGLLWAWDLESVSTIPFL